eukprot:14047475-Ditylum_brightwellii.AAC.1
MIYEDSSEAETGTEELLMTMVEEHYLENHKKNKYRWIHDNIEKAASSLIEEESFASFRHSIGEILYQELSEHKLEACLFEVANLLNTDIAGVTNIECAKIDLMAAEKARKMSAFDKCSDYTLKGISMLPSDKWESHPDLA